MRSALFIVLATVIPAHAGPPDKPVPDLDSPAVKAAVATLEAAGMRTTAIGQPTGILNLYGPGITDATLAALAPLDGLIPELGIGNVPAVTPVGLAKLALLTRLERLELVNCHCVVGPELAAVGQLKRLKALDLSYNKNLTDDGLKHLRGLTDLRTLAIRKTPITGSGLADLAPLTGLRELALTESRKFVPANARHLAAFRNLAALDLSDFETSDAGATVVGGLPGLVELKLSHAGMTDAGAARLAGLTKLKSLVLNGNPVTDAGVAHFRGLTGLVQLDLGYTQVADAGLAHLRGLTGLEVLTLSGNSRITDAGTVHLRGLVGLNYLNLYSVRITDAGLENLTPLTALGRKKTYSGGLDLTRTLITGSGFKHLPKMPDVTSFDLYGTKVTDAGLAELAKAMPQLEFISLHDTAVTDAGLVHLAAFPKLDWIALGTPGVTDAGLPKLYPLKQLKRVSLPTAKVTPAGVAALRRALPNAAVED